MGTKTRALIATSVLLTAAGFVLPPASRARQPNPPKGFVVLREHIGSGRGTTYSIEALSAEGTFLQVYGSLPGLSGEPSFSRELRFSDGLNVRYQRAADGEYKATTKRPGQSPAMDPKQNCARGTDGSYALSPLVGMDTMQTPIGPLQVVHFGDPSPSTKWEMWVAPSLGCLVVRQEISFKDERTGAISSTNTTEIVAIGTDPAPEMFAIPTAREMSPRDFWLAHTPESRRRPGDAERMERIHQRYLQNRLENDLTNVN